MKWKRGHPVQVLSLGQRIWVTWYFEGRRKNKGLGLDVQVKVLVKNDTEISQVRTSITAQWTGGGLIDNGISSKKKNLQLVFS